MYFSLSFYHRKQAEATANRLKMFHSNKKIDKIVISTMTRAKETGEIIKKSLPDVPYEYCDFLREGAPCTPEPASSTWRPEYYVRMQFKLIFCLQMFNDQHYLKNVVKSSLA